ncbi:Rne/Rng family ribonuclease [Pseudorhodoplanes sp.]|uniref:Rne/Rng family ribonuclease n=1 Tax=Pseudorhodoplanes sp. TaxID=1934341 RepID=UPI00391B985C
MSNKMLIDATHPEETRVVVLRGNRVEEFDFESASRKQLRGNIYLAKVTRVEPSLQAAFVDYGGNRHGFLAFAEIHPDYYQIPVADRQALLEAERHAERDEDENGGERSEQRRGRGRRHRGRGAGRNRHRDVVKSDVVAAHEDGETPRPVTDDATSPHPVIPSDHEVRGHETAAEAAARSDGSPGGTLQPADALQSDRGAHGESEAAAGHPAPDLAPAQATEPAASETAISETATKASAETATVPADEPAAAQATAIADIDIVEAIAESKPQDLAAHPDEQPAETVDRQADSEDAGGDGAEEEAGAAEAKDKNDDSDDDSDDGDEDDGDDEEEEEDEEEVVESVGGDAIEEVMERAPRVRRHYKIQEVIKRRQVMLVQVVKEERGTKGAALTTYLSLAGRYSVLMPNTARGGGISRKVTNAEDRRHMKEIAEELEVPEGMGVILRTAGASRTKLEIKRDFEYLLRLWETVRDLTLKSTAPTLVYEEGSLVKRAIRDLYHKDIEEIVVEGESAYREAKDFMRMLMPSAVKNVVPYHDTQPIFARYGIESQLDAMFQPTVQLKSGGYVVINQTEALVAIDVNSGRATREHSIEETATKTNIEAAAEIARQLRLRDLAGLIVIDFIDMEEGRNNRAVERKLKEALKSDRARIQVGRISHFGLLEMSRQRIRSSVLESSTEVCPHCGGTGHVRAVASVALQLVRAVEETLMKGATHNLIVRSRSDVAIYVLNHKRAHLRMLEERFKIAISVTVDPTLTGHPSFAVDRGEQVMSLDQARTIASTIRPDSIPAYEDEDEAETDEVLDEIETEGEEASAEPAEAGDDERDRGGRRRRRRGRRGRGRDGEARPHAGDAEVAAAQPEAAQPDDEAAGESDDAESDADDEAVAATNGDGEKRRRRRGRRGGRRNRRDREDDSLSLERDDEETAPEAVTADAPAESQPSAMQGLTGSEPEPVNAQSAGDRATAPQAAAEPAHVNGPAAPEPATEQPVRRRSTVREAPPAYTAADQEAYAPQPAPPAPPPAPAETGEPAVQQEAEKPRRRGWWSMRG